MFRIMQTALTITKKSCGKKILSTTHRPQSADVGRSSAAVTAGVSKLPDLLMQKLRSAASAEALLGSTARHMQLMHHQHLLQVLRSLFLLVKESRSEYDVQEIIRNPTFGSLCQALNRNARVLEPNDYIEALKILSYLQVPVNSLIQQTLLQLVRTNINNFNVRQIMFLDFLLSRHADSNPLIDALKLALPLVFQIHLPLELDHEDLPQLREMLYYSCTRHLPDRCINNIVTGLLLHDHEIDMHAAKNIVFALLEVNVTAELYPLRVKLLHLCFDVLSHSMHSLSYDEVLRLTAKLKNRIIDKHMEYYHMGVMDAIADYVVQKAISLEKALLIARVMSKIAHTHFPLLEYICRLAYEDPSVLSRARPNILFAFVNCLSNADYTPATHEWDVIRHHISQNPVLDISNVAMPWTKFCLELASLGHYDARLLSAMFSERVLSGYLSREESALDYIQLLTLHEAARARGEVGAAPPERVLRRARELYPVHARSQPLEEALARGLGGKEYFASNVQLPGGIVADYIVSLQNGGYPIEVHGEEEGKTTLEQLNLPESSLVICILKFNKGCYSLNSDRLRGTFRLLGDVLSAQGRPTLMLNLHAWLQLPGAERTPYLMREIRYKCQEAGHSLAAI